VRLNCQNRKIYMLKKAKELYTEKNNGVHVDSGVEEDCVSDAVHSDLGLSMPQFHICKMGQQDLR
jgi:hypothetical protein